jgi:hypothetical protein
VSSEQLLEAYADGEISRRTLMRRLVAAGVSMGAAATYAHVLAPQAKAESRHLIRTEYPDGSIKIVSSKLDKITEKEKVSVKVKSERKGQYKVVISLEKNKGPWKELGSAKIDLDKDKSERLKVKIDGKALKGKDKVTLFANLQYHFPPPMGYAGFVYDEKEID